MHKAGRLTAEGLDMLGNYVKPGVTTQRLDDLAFQFAMDNGAYPATLFYRGYTKSICTSINHVVCHGIPDDKPLREGDVMNIDYTLIVDGWHGDSSRMYGVGDIPRKAARLIEITYESLLRGIKAVRPGGTTGDIGFAIQRYAEAERCSVVRDFCGHGVGQLFHDAPNILHYGSPGEGSAAQARHDLHHRADDQSRQAGREGAFRRLDGSDARPFALGPVRTHHRRHRDRLRDLHAVARRPRQSAQRPMSHRLRQGAEHGPAVHGIGRHGRRRIITAIANACARASRRPDRTPCPITSCSNCCCSARFPQRDVKPLAKELIQRFGSFAEVLGAPAARLTEVKGVGSGVALDLKIVEAALRRMAKGAVAKRPVLSSWSSVIDYCRTAMAFAEREQFRILFLDKKNALIADEVQQTGTVDHTPVYPREVMRRALELSASAIILVHNHPSGDPTPSGADMKMTRELIDIAKPLGIAIHDHIVVGRDGHASFRGLGLL